MINTVDRQITFSTVKNCKYVYKLDLHIFYGCSKNEENSKSKGNVLFSSFCKRYTRTNKLSFFDVII